MCLCSEIRDLAESPSMGDVSRLGPGLNKHLADVRTILTKSKPLSRDMRYQVVPNNQRTMKILNTLSTDLTKANEAFHRFRGDFEGFWQSSDVQPELRRRLGCVVVFLRSKLDSQNWIPANMAAFFHGQKPSELRYAGKKYIKMARRLGGVGSMLWLPLDVPSSTYERYLNMDDDEVFNHLLSLGVDAPDYNKFVQHLISLQLNDSSLSLCKYNLLNGYGDILPSSDQVLFILSSLGGTEVPIDLLKSVRAPRKRWTSEGEMETLTATEFGLPDELVSVLSDEGCISEAGARMDIEENILEDGTHTWSIRSESSLMAPSAMSRQMEEESATQALKLICFACPPCYEGKVNWPSHKKKAIWKLLEKAIERRPVPLALRETVIEALLFFSERDSFAIRQQALDRARLLLRKPMPWYFHASVALFESILYRLEGHFDKSNDKILETLSQTKNNDTRCDNALKGRLHVSYIENKIHRYEHDVASCMYKWEGIHPLSTFEIEVTRRLQGTAAKYFHTIGDFQTAQASLEQHLWLNSTQPIRPNSRRLIVTRLAEIYCELQEYEKALESVQSELDGTPELERKGRPFRRLCLVLVEIRLGQRDPDAAEARLKLLEDIEPPEIRDLNDQYLHMRRLLLVARTAHERNNVDEALGLWQYALQRMQELTIFNSRHGWTAVVIYLSMAHVQLCMGDEASARESWAAAVDLSRKEKCEYVMPVFATAWLQKVVISIHGEYGWPFRIMLPGGKPDISWP